MNDGDPTNAPRGRAQVPGSVGGVGAPSGRASVPAGRASVPAARASVPAGRASVPESRSGAGSGADFDADERPTGRATVGSDAGTVGRATVGRASVRSSAFTAADRSGEDVLEGPGGSPRAGARSAGKSTRTPSSRKKRRRIRNLIVAAFAVFIMVAGAGVVGGTYYYESVPSPEQLTLPESTTIFYSDGTTPIAKIGTENRTIIPFDQIPLHVQRAVVSAEDRTFYENSGFDVKGIVRAVWRNVTGASEEGASTITQQYARISQNLGGNKYKRKMKEIVLAAKLRQEHTPEQILEMYLNTVYFGRGAYGCEAAAQVYFGKGCKDLTVDEGIILAGVIKDPEGSDPSAGSPYDPTRNPESAQDRFNYIRNGMVELKFISQSEADALKVPAVRKYDPINDPSVQGQFGLDKPHGMVVHHVMDELWHLKDPVGKQKFPDLKTGGYKIRTTIDVGTQKAAEAAASGATKESPLWGQPDNLQAALVAVEVGTGRVKAYYGGPKGDGVDYAGVYRDPVLGDSDELVGHGRHRPGSSFKIYTAGAALVEGFRIDSYWDGSNSKTFPGRPTPVTNAGNASCKGGAKHCTMEESIVQSLNTPFYAMTVHPDVGSHKVLSFAHQAGIRYMWNDDLKRTDLNSLRMTSPEEVGKAGFYGEIGFGQYGVTVLDHANATATIANRGAAATAHFVVEVTRGDESLHAESVGNTKQIKDFTPQMADDLVGALEKVVPYSGVSLAGGRDSAGKSGTWQLGDTGDNADAWWVGFTASDSASERRGLSTAVWVGNKGKEKAIKICSYPGKKPSGCGKMYGANGPGRVAQAFLNSALKGSPMLRFPEGQGVGHKLEGNSSSPAPTPVPSASSGQPGQGQPGQGQPGGPTIAPSTPGGGGGGGGEPCLLPRRFCPPER